MTKNVVKLFTDSKQDEPNISDINSWENENFYKEGRFMTISDFIATYENHEQTVFNVIAYHNIDANLSISKNPYWKMHSTQ